ncbi:hypothetical protein EMIT0215P_90017 [Pseudomonas serboccidentalis]
MFLKYEGVPGEKILPAAHFRFYKRLMVSAVSSLTRIRNT